TRCRRHGERDLAVQLHLVTGARRGRGRPDLVPTRSEGAGRVHASVFFPDLRYDGGDRVPGDRRAPVAGDGDRSRESRDRMRGLVAHRGFRSGGGDGSGPRVRTGGAARTALVQSATGPVPGGVEFGTGAALVGRGADRDLRSPRTQREHAGSAWKRDARVGRSRSERPSGREWNLLVTAAHAGSEAGSFGADARCPAAVAQVECAWRPRPSRCRSRNGKVAASTIPGRVDRGRCSDYSPAEPAPQLMEFSPNGGPTASAFTDARRSSVGIPCRLR